MTDTLRTFLALAGLLSSSAWGTTYYVNDNTDAPLGGAVTCVTQQPCTLRAAIEAANANPGSDTITFEFSGSSQVIALTSALPAIVAPLTIDGYTLGTGGVANTDATGQNAQITIRLDGQASPGLAGLLFLPGSDGSVLRGVAITRFKGPGVAISGASHIAVQGNLIGTDGSGENGDETGALANGGPAVLIDSSAALNTVGGPALADRNLLVSDSDSPAVHLNGDGTEGNRITDNLIGTNRLGTLRVGTARGVEIGYANGNFLHANVIGALIHGIHLYGSGNGNDHTITANKIGTGTGGQPIGGGGDGILIQDAPGPSALGPQGTRIGGTNAGEGNLIAHWEGNGVRIERQRSNGNLARHAILGNSIHDNGALGIELVAQGAGNGPGHAPAGVNDAIPAPAILSAVMGGGGVQASYQLQGAPASTLYRFEAFASTACDISGWGEGQRYLGAGMLSTNAAGTASGSALWLGAAAGEFLTLTATRDYGGEQGLAETSEFSQCVLVQSKPGGGPGEPVGTVAVPALGQAGLALLSGALALLGLRRQRAKKNEATSP
ncbi:MAG: right-handed parallel beta-helix repeat-containing protein [Ottowia sp.]|uniref:IPTL-CTERM sorting domain-containing protein n=1 Tax=Ottowia sp. TaxID=1898956 RepID=UPI003C75178B